MGVSHRRFDREEPMSLRQKYLKILADIIPVGATSLSLLIGSMAPSGANPQRSESQERPNKASVSERLAAIRGAVSDIAKSGGGSQPPQSTKSPTPASRWANWMNTWLKSFNNWKNWNNYFQPR